MATAQQDSFVQFIQQLGLRAETGKKLWAGTCLLLNYEL